MAQSTTETATQEAAAKYPWSLLRNSPVANSRTDDIWFFDELTGWLVNSSGYVCKTEDGGASWVPKFFLYPNLPSRPYLRCMSWANRQIGWFGAVTGVDVHDIQNPSQYLRTLLHHTVDGGETWHAVENLPEGSPGGICGFHAVNEEVAYGSGTNDPGLPGPAIIKTTDNGASWELIPMHEHASNLIDIYFFDEDNGFVVGGLIDENCEVDHKAYPPPRLSRYGQVKPVVLRTFDGGRNWVNTAASIDNFQCGEWGWKIQFLNEQHGFISLENFRDARILKTNDGGESWTLKCVAKDQHPDSPPINNDLEGIGFINEQEGWVGGWGFEPLSTPVGGLENSFTADGGETWIPQNHLPNPDSKIPSDPRYRINRYRFVTNIDGSVTTGYCSGQQVFRMSTGGSGKKKTFAARTVGLSQSMDRLEPANSSQSHMSAIAGGEAHPDFGFDVAAASAADGTVHIEYTVPESAGEVFIGLWNKFAFHVRTLVSEKTDSAGRRSVVWDGRDDQGNPLSPGTYILRMCTEGEKGFSGMIRLPGTA
ncbi:MAG: FlgD immunoglobulin-like domain containing protein [Pseudomonadota bacterium]